MTTELDDVAWYPDEREIAVETPRKCAHPRWKRSPADAGGWICDPALGGCGNVALQHRVRRGRQSRNYGNRAELSVARTYGGTKIGHAGGPVDVRGEDWNTQVKTHRRKPPAEWTKAFTAMAANRERMPRLLLRFVQGPGIAPIDYFVVRGDDWLAWHGKDGDR